MFTIEDLKNFRINIQLFAEGDDQDDANAGDDEELTLPGNDDTGDQDDQQLGAQQDDQTNPDDTDDSQPDGNQSDPNKPDNNETVNWEERYQQKDADYQRLERRFTKVTQEMSALKPDLEVVRYIKDRPDLAQRVQQLIDQYDDGNLPQVNAQNEVEKLKQDFAFEKELLRLQTKDQVFARNEQAIRDYAETEYGIDFDETKDPKTLKMIYNAWKGENAGQLAAKAALDAKKAAAEKKEARQNAKLQGANGPAKTNLDYKNMSDEQILASLGYKSLISEE